jgi:hypothetical protein
MNHVYNVVSMPSSVTVVVLLASMLMPLWFRWKVVSIISTVGWLLVFCAFSAANASSKGNADYKNKVNQITV